MCMCDSMLEYVCVGVLVCVREDACMCVFVCMHSGKLEYLCIRRLGAGFRVFRSRLLPTNHVVLVK